MPPNRVQTLPNGRMLKKEFDITAEHDARLTLLATYLGTSRSAVVRRLLDTHLDAMVEAIYRDAQP